jgi:hypothetical protein
VCVCVCVCVWGPFANSLPGGGGDIASFLIKKKAGKYNF